MQTLPAECHPFPGPRDFQGVWISPRGETRQAFHVLMRTTFEIGATGAHSLYLCVLGEYEIFINGQRLYFGGIPRQPHHMLYDQVPLDGLLHSGENCLAIHAVRMRTPVHGVLCDIVDADGNTVCSSDTRWLATVDHAWRDGEHPQPIRNDYHHEVFDARHHAADWNVVGFPADGWEPMVADEELSSFGLVPRETLLPEELGIKPVAIACVEEGLDILSRGRGECLSVQLSAAGQPVTYSTVDDVETLLEDEAQARFRTSTNHERDRCFDGIYAPSVVLDLGAVTTGFLEFEVTGTSDAHVDIGYVERLVNGHFNNAIEVNYADRYTLREGRQVFRTSNWKSFRYVKLRFTNCAEGVLMHRVNAVVCRYPFSEQGGFESSDNTLTGVYRMCRDTIRLCARDYFMDTPWRERSQWTGDVAAVIVPGVYACFGDAALPRQFLRQSAAVQTARGTLSRKTTNFDEVTNSGGFPSYLKDIHEYSLWWIQGLWQYFMRTSEREMIHAHYPVVQRVLDWYISRLNEYGLFATIPRTFVDHIFTEREGVIGPLVALLHGTLADALAMAELVGDTYTASRYTRVRETVQANFMSAFFDANEECFRNRCEDGRPVGGISEHGNLGPILWDLCDADTAAGIVARFYDRADITYLEAEPFCATVVLRALRRCGRRDLAIQLIRDRWGGRMLAKGHTTTTEEWNASGSLRGSDNEYLGIFRSLSHAWSACPAEWLSVHLMGLDILEPGCGRIALDPFVADFDYTVRYPLPQGVVEVRCSEGRVTTTIPDGVLVA